MPFSMLEKKVKEKINALVEDIWPDVWRYMPVPMGMGKAGIPDHFFIAPVVITQEMVGQTYGMAVLVEAKRTGVKPTELQYAQLSLAVKAGACAVYCAGIEDLPELREILERRFCLK